MTGTPFVVLDACIPANFSLCDTPLRLAEPRRLFEPKWSSKKTNTVQLGCRPAGQTIGLRRLPSGPRRLADHRKRWSAPQSEQYCLSRSVVERGIPVEPPCLVFPFP